MIIQEEIKKLKEEIERCNSKKDGDEHFSKENWNLRGQFCKGELKALKSCQKEISNLKTEIKMWERSNNDAQKKIKELEDDLAREKQRAGEWMQDALGKEKMFKEMIEKCLKEWETGCTWETEEAIKQFSKELLKVLEGK